MNYEDKIAEEWKQWRNNLFKPSGFFEHASRKFSRKVNQMIPEKIHKVLTSAVKGVVQTALFGVQFTPKTPVQIGLSLEERDKLARELIDKYKKIASAEGAGTGLGGFKLSLVDFPALLSIKMKFLFELSHIYGFSTSDKQERWFILQVFQLAFSGDEHRQTVWNNISSDSQLMVDPNKEIEIDWRKLQQEYRDSLDFRKLLQMVPGIGAVVGAWANYGLLHDLGETGMQCYRYRILRSTYLNF